MKKVTLSKEQEKALNNEEFYTKEDFISDCKAYIKACKAGRLLYDVIHVSSSGMSRNIKIRSYEGTATKGYFRGYERMLKVLGETIVKSEWSTVKVSGCGMNMLFATNYNIIHTFGRMGLLTKKDVNALAQTIS